ncbi:uncharacterized protein (DUF58 family) [Caldalkalibacillus uzonensis]|uniref:Uncharacterized protein (DUF58 family) n=1 Tax=Caldalkalibacillus uzonensis TaxID=353224 RepID=A0ABU0CM20_9BACI|nr:DUF58 domain-containing protein [Caldalkalibacillus uzonensis]MDQ0337453.1 uncharacterized protein (DUF58 family) [Caldalkalibacillus uzonensis]
MNEAPVLDPDFLRRLEQMKVLSRKMVSGRWAGKRRSRLLGQSVEFADYRSYTPGDDIRRLDWHAYGRLGKLFLKTYLDEQELHISLYIDSSRSMAFGRPHKFQRAVELCAAIGYLSLHHFDRVSVYAFDQQIKAKQRNLTGKGQVRELFQFLQSLNPAQEGNLNTALADGRAVHGQPGLAIIFSDFLFPNGYEEGIRFIQAARQEVILVHLLSQHERNPGLEGDWRLIDSETGEGKEISLNPRVLGRYKEAVSLFQQEIAAFAFKRDMLYVDVHTEHSLEHTIYRVFKSAGMLG